jgi:hypothetical protein
VEDLGVAHAGTGAGVWDPFAAQVREG